jgi:uncharacterized protein YbaR (Trm112 family)
VTFFFVSHKESDVLLARAAVNLLMESFQIESEVIFCSSLPGHSLKFGTTIESQLRDNLNESSVLFPLLTQDSIQSTWVLFELGAAWALNRVVVPILGPGVAYRNLPGALSAYPCISVEEAESKVRARIEDALKQVSTDLKIGRKTGGRQTNAVDDFIKVLREWKSMSHELKSANAPSPICPQGYEIFQTPVGYSVFKSISEPFNCICPTCYANSHRQVLLQGNLQLSEQLVCTSCKTTYRLKKATPILTTRRAQPNWIHGYTER